MRQREAAGTSEKEIRNPLWRHALACGIGIGVTERLGQERIRLLVVPLELKPPQSEGTLLDHVDFLLLRRPPEELTRIRLVDQPPFRPFGKKEILPEMPEFNRPPAFQRTPVADDIVPDSAIVEIRAG